MKNKSLDLGDVLGDDDIGHNHQEKYKAKARMGEISKLSVSVPRDLHLAFKAKAIANDVKVKDLIADFMESYINS